MIMYHDDDDHLTQGQWMSEGCHEYARNVGADHPEQAWILTPFDTWERNPNYAGEPVPHPDSYDDYGHTYIDPEHNRIMDALGYNWTYYPGHYGEHDVIKMDQDDTPDGGYPCRGFEDAVRVLLDRGYLDEDVAEAWINE